jgi:hypothetical protein
VTAIPSDSPAIYVYGETKPSRQQAAAGTGALLAPITAWTAIDDGFAISIPAIPDPYPNDAVTERTYWIAINFKLKTGAAFQTVIQPLYMERVRARNKTARVEPGDVAAEWSVVTDYATNEELTRMIEKSFVDLKKDLKKKGLNWSGVQGADGFSQAIVYKTLMRVNIKQRRNVGDVFDENIKLYAGLYKTELESLLIDYDADGDGEPEVKSIPDKETTVILER